MLRSLTAMTVTSKAITPLTNTTGSRFRGFVKNEQAEEIEDGIDEVLGPSYGYYDSSHRPYGELHHDLVEPPKVWTLSNKYWNIREKPTSKGERKPSPLETKWSTNTQYQLYREVIGYNEFADTIPVNRIRQRYLQNIWSKKYYRDDEGKAVTPDRYVHDEHIYLSPVFSPFCYLLNSSHSLF